MKDENENSFKLLNTIRISKNLKELSERLPKSKYKDNNVDDFYNNKNLIENKSDFYFLNKDKSSDN